MAQSNAEPAPRQTCAFPSSLPPQLVISWLPVRAVGSALCASAAWHRASARHQPVACSCPRTAAGVGPWWPDICRWLFWGATQRPRHTWPKPRGTARGDQSRAKLETTVIRRESPRCYQRFRGPACSRQRSTLQDGLMVHQVCHEFSSYGHHGVRARGRPDLRRHRHARGVGEGGEEEDHRSPPGISSTSTKRPLGGAWASSEASTSTVPGPNRVRSTQSWV